MSTVDFPIAVVGGTAVLCVPAPITAENVRLIEEGVAMNLAHLRRVLAKINESAAKHATQEEGR